MKSRIKALIAEEKSKRKGRHHRSSSFTTHTQLEKTNPSPHSESTELDAELALKGKSHKFINRYSSGARISDPLLLKPTEEPVTKIKTCELCAAINSASYWKQSEADAKELSEGASLQESSQFMDALDIFGTRKEFFLKILLDPGSPLVHYLHNRQAFNSKTGLTKSVSFPVAGSAGRRAFQLSNYICDQGPASYAKGEDKFQVCNHSHDSTKFKSNINMGDQSVASLAEGREDGISIPTLGRPKSFNNLPPCAPRGLKTEHENKPVIKRFKKLRQKISHAIRESRKEKQQQIILDPLFHKIPYDRKYSKIMMEDADDLQESVIEKCSKYSPLSSCGNDQSASACGKQIDDIDKQCFRRTTSYNDSFDRYCRLFESSFNNEAKHQFSEGLKLRAEQTPPPCESSKKSLGRLLSLPDLRSYFTPQIEDSPGPSGTPVRTSVDRSSSTVSTRLNEQKIPALSVDQESQKLLDAQAESGGLENLVEYSETPSDSDNLTTGKSTSHHKHGLEPTARPANLEPSSYDVVNSNSKENTTNPTEFSITEGTFTTCFFTSLLSSVYLIRQSIQIHGSHFGITWGENVILFVKKLA